MKPKTATKVIVFLIAVLIAVSGVAAYLLVQNVQGKPATAFTTLTVYYADGTHYTFPNSMIPGFSFIDPSQGNKVVDRVVCEMHVIATYTGTITGYTITGEGQGRLYDANNNNHLATLWTMPISISGSTLPSGQDTVVMGVSITAADLDAIMPTLLSDYEYYYVVWSPDPGVTVTLNFAGGSSQSRTVMPIRMAWRFKFVPDWFSLDVYYGGGGV